MHRPRAARACVLFLLLSGAAGHPALAAGPSLYDRMGGGANVTAVVSDMIDQVVADPRLARSFDKVNIKHLKAMLVEQICDLAGGPCKYSGDSMRDAHAGLGITQAELYGLVQALKDSM